MKQPITITFVNAFTTSANHGNPAAVCIIDDFPDIIEMQNISTKNNISETAFLKNTSKNNFDIRWFTPVSEAPICVHATLASAHVLYQNKIIEKNTEINFFNSNNKFIASEMNGWISLNFPSINIAEMKSSKVIDEILKNLNIVYLGLSGNILFAELRYNNEVRNFIPNLELISSLPYRALLITSKDTKYDFISRYFAPSVGIDEDPVCGSAHCRLIPYWAKKLKKDEMIAYQASMRGGIIRCKDLGDRVIISGQSISTHSYELPILQKVNYK
jgi:predicted PhzF superfamily epimerase YddE/YHI9